MFTVIFVKTAFEMYANGKMINVMVVYFNEKDVCSSQNKLMNKADVTVLLKSFKYKYRNIVIDDGLFVYIILYGKVCG